MATSKTPSIQARAKAQVAKMKELLALLTQARARALELNTDSRRTDPFIGNKSKSWAQIIGQLENDCDHAITAINKALDAQKTLELTP